MLPKLQLKIPRPLFQQTTGSSAKVVAKPTDQALSEASTPAFSGLKKANLIGVNGYKRLCAQLRRSSNSNGLKFYLRVLLGKVSLPLQTCTGPSAVLLAPGRMRLDRLRLGQQRLLNTVGHHRLLLPRLQQVRTNWNLQLISSNRLSLSGSYVFPSWQALSSACTKPQDLIPES